MVVFQNCVVSVKGEPGLCSETFITPSNDETEEVNAKVEEVIYIKEEGVPEAVACPLIETEPEVRVCANVCVCVCMHIGVHVHLVVCARIHAHWCACDLCLRACVWGGGRGLIPV